MLTRYVQHRPQERIFSISDAKVSSGVDGYAWHLNPIPQGASFDERHSDRIRINYFKIVLQLRDGYDGKMGSSVHNVYMFLVRDNSSGPTVPKYSTIASMDNSNVATSCIVHDAKDRFRILRRYRRTFTGGCNTGTREQPKLQYPMKDRIDFSKTIKIGQDSEFKSANDGSYANTQKNAWVLYIIGQSSDLNVDGHVIVNFTSLN